MRARRGLDLFCKQGGATRGYQAAGFEMTGVDLDPQPRYCGEEFFQGDAFEFLRTADLTGYTFIHASPPCQGYSIMNNLPWNRDRDYPHLILETREALQRTGLPYVIENVGGARFGAKGLIAKGLQDHGLKAGFLCGQMFGLPLYRHRYFETSFFWMQPGHPKHTVRIRSGRSLAGRARDIVYSAAEDSRGLATWPGRRTEPAGLAVVAQNGAQAYGKGLGHSAGWRVAAEAMGVDWMDRNGTSQAIPPVMTEYIGRALLQAIS